MSEASYATESNPPWTVKWYRPDDVVLITYHTTYMTNEVLTGSLDKMLELLDTLPSGDLSIYCIMDQSSVQGYDLNITATPALHPVFFHARCGKFYVIVEDRDLRLLNETYMLRRPNAIRFAATVAAAGEEIAQRRADYFARQHKLSNGD